jgi:hypothetical protein
MSLTSRLIVRGAVLAAFLAGFGASLCASAAEPARSFQIVENLEGSRVISWRAVSRESGGHFVLWRIGEDAQQVARVDALPGAQAYRFVDHGATGRAGFVIYRLAYEASDGSGSLLVVATLAESNLRDTVPLTLASVVPEALTPAQNGIGPDVRSKVLSPVGDVHASFEFSGPEPPPPRG